MSRSRVAFIAALVLVLGAAFLPKGAAGPQNPNWTSDPTEGPSPNTINVENTTGGECLANGMEPEGFGPVVLGFVQAEVLVHLQNQQGTQNLTTQAFGTDQTGSWGGDFGIVAGLSPGVYPLTAECAIPPSGMGVPLVLGGEPTVLFSYTDRSYTAPDESEPAGPVEAEASFTG